MHEMNLAKEFMLHRDKGIGSKGDNYCPNSPGLIHTTPPMVWFKYLSGDASPQNYKC